MSPGEAQHFLAPGKGPGRSEVQLAAISSVFRSLRLQGRCLDALGGLHLIEETLDLDRFASVYLSGTWVRPRDEYLRDIADRLKGIEQRLDSIAKDLHPADAG